MTAARTDDRVGESAGEREPPEEPGGSDPRGGAPNPAAVRNWTILSLALALASFATAAGTFAVHGEPRPTAGAAALGLGFAAIAILPHVADLGILGALDDGWAEHRPYVGLATGLFGLGLLLGVALFAAGIDLLELVQELLLGQFDDEEFAAEGGLDLTATFFVLNNTPPFLASILGALTLGLFTAFVMVFNGVILGNLAVALGLETGFGPILALLLPHGVFELSALFVAAGVGFRLFHRAVQRVLGEREALFTRAYLSRTALLVAFAWLVLVLAAFVEAYLTIPIAEFLFAEQLE